MTNLSVSFRIFHPGPAAFPGHPEEQLFTALQQYSMNEEILSGITIL
jgi:hypothetical protein